MGRRLRDGAAILTVAVAQHVRVVGLLFLNISELLMPDDEIEDDEEEPVAVTEAWLEALWDRHPEEEECDYMDCRVCWLRKADG